jgi:tetratricopeptide (TPR) repeat protein
VAEKPAASTEKTAEPPLNVVSAKGGETSSNAAEKPAEKPAASTEKPAAAAEKTAENTAGTSQAQQHKQDGDAFFFQGSYKEAADAYKKAVGVDPRYLDGWDALGNAYVALNDYAQAADAYKRGLEVDPSYTLGHYNLGYCYRALSSFDQAATSYRTYLLQAPNDPDALFGLGSSLAAAGRNDEAIKAFQDYLAHESRPEASAFAKSAAAELERLKSGKPAEASKAPGEGASKDIPLPGTAREALGQGDTAFQTKNYEDAAALYAQAVSIASNNVEARYKLGVTRALLRDYPGAVEHLSRALESDPKNSAIRERLNRVWQLAKAERKNELYTGTLPFAPSAEARSNGERAITEGRYAMALSYFDAALSYDPKDASAHKGRGDALLSLSRSEEAKEEYLYALSLAPREALPYRALGDLYRLRGDKKQARYYYDLFLLRAAPGTVPAEELAAVRAYLAKK